MERFNKDKAIAACCLIVGIAFFIGAQKLPPTNLVNDPGPRIFPTLGALIVIISSLAILLKKYEEPPKTYYTPKQWKSAAIMFGVFVMYALLLWLVGYLIATPIVLFLTCFMFTEKGIHIALWKRIVFAIAVTAFLYWIFARILVMLLPVGIIFS